MVELGFDKIRTHAKYVLHFHLVCLREGGIVVYNGLVGTSFADTTKQPSSSSEGWTDIHFGFEGNLSLDKYRIEIVEMGAPSKDIN